MASHPSSSTLDSADDSDDRALRDWAVEAAPLPALAAQVRLPEELGELGAELVASWMREAPEPHIGEVLDGHYALERVLGRGGMGVVYAAKNLRTGRAVAIKRIASEQSLGAARRRAAAERMRKEARAASRIRHPNVVDLLDVGGSDDAPYLVMELLEGESLGRRIARAPLAWSEAVSVLLPVLDGVGAAHAVGVIHRDLKPDNLFLCSAGSGLVPKVLDFGVAAMRAETGPEINDLTRTGAVLGTPAYMPLEQLTGGAVDARTDLYALCVVLYQALTGKLPFRAQNAGELAVHVATSHPTPPSSFAPELRGAREALLLRGLARDPASRFQTTYELATALRNVDTLDRAARRGRYLVVALVGAFSVGFGFLLVLGDHEDVTTPRKVDVHAPRQRVEASTPTVVDTAPGNVTRVPAPDAGDHSTPKRVRKRAAALADPHAEETPRQAPVPRAPSDLQVEDF